MILAEMHSMIFNKLLDTFIIVHNIMCIVWSLLKNLYIILHIVHNIHILLLYDIYNTIFPS